MGKAGRSVIALAVAAALVAFVQDTRGAEFSAESLEQVTGLTARFFVKGSLLRKEMRDGLGQEQVLLRLGTGRGETLVLYPRNKMFMRIPSVSALSPAGGAGDGGKIGCRRLLGQESILGYLCDKFEIVFHNRYRGRLIQWIARKLGYPIRMLQVGGPPGGAFRWELRNIREERVPETLFRLPPDFVEIKKPIQGFCGAGVCRFNFF